MPERLQENGFLTINLKQLLGTATNTEKNASNNKTANSTNANGTENATSELAATVSNIEDWDKELKNRVDANNKLGQEARKTDYEIEIKVFEEYFNTAWAGKDCAQLLLQFGEPLRKLIKVYGFTNDNPIVEFLQQDYVVDNLIKTRLLNANTFKAIFNSIANRWIAHSEFKDSNYYNLIYCKALYKKPLKEIEEYLKIQKDILNPSSQYTYNDKLKNIFTFLYIPTAKELDIEKLAYKISAMYKEKDFDIKQLPKVSNKNITLNSLDLAHKIKDKLGIKPKNNNGNTSHMSADAMNKLVNKLSEKGTLAQFFTVIQHLSVTTNIAEAKQALKHEKFHNLTAEQIAKATAEVAPLLNKGKLPEAEAKTLVSVILGKLE